MSEKREKGSRDNGFPRNVLGNYLLKYKLPHLNPLRLSCGDIRKQEKADTHCDCGNDELICKKARYILKHRNNTFYEDMYLIDEVSGGVVAAQTHSLIEHEITYNPSLNNAIKKHSPIHFNKGLAPSFNVASRSEAAMKFQLGIEPQLKLNMEPAALEAGDILPKL